MVWTQVKGADPVYWNPNSQGVDLAVGALENPDKGKCPLIMRGPRDTMKCE